MEGHFEAKKHSYRQTQDGVVVSFVIHPHDVTPEFAAAPLGTIFMVGYATPQENGPGTTTERQKTEQHRLVKLAAVLCGDERFRDWFLVHMPPYDRNAETCAVALRLDLRIASRRELATNQDAAAKFEALVTRYRQETGQMAEVRP